MSTSQRDDLEQSWLERCEHSPAYSGERALESGELPFEDVFLAGEPLMADSVVILGNRHCYDRDSMHQWVETFRQRTVRPRYPDTRQDLTKNDLSTLGYSPDDQRSLIDDRPSLDLLRDADDTDREAHRALRAEQNIVARLAMHDDVPDAVEPIENNELHAWFIRRVELPDEAHRLLARRERGSFVVFWRPDTPSIGSLAFLNHNRTVHRSLLVYDAARGYHSVDLPLAGGGRGASDTVPHYLSLTQLLLDRHNLRWPRESPPFRGFRPRLTRDQAEMLLRRRPRGTYVVRRSSTDQRRLVLSLHAADDSIHHYAMRIHSEPTRRGISGAADEYGFTTLENYLEAVRAEGRLGQSAPRVPIEL